MQLKSSRKALLFRSSAKTAVLGSVSRFGFTYICIGALPIFLVLTKCQIGFVSVSLPKVLMWSFYVTAIATLISALFDLPKMIKYEYVTTFLQTAIVFSSILLLVPPAILLSFLLPAKPANGMEVLFTYLSLVVAACGQIGFGLLRDHLRRRTPIHRNRNLQDTNEAPVAE